MFEKLAIYEQIGTNRNNRELRLNDETWKFIGGVTCLNNKAFHLSACGSQMLTEGLRLLACRSYFYV